MGEGTDWRAIEDSPEFEQLSRSRRRVVVPLLAVFVVWYGGFLVLTAYAHHFMGESVYRGITVGYVLALSLIVMAWLLAWIYVRAANSTLEPLRDEAVPAEDRR